MKIRWSYLFGKVVVISELVAFMFFLTILTLEIIVGIATRGKVYDSPREIPENKVGLLLGTSKYLPDGKINLYYKYRVEAAIELYKANKIEFILISGNNGTKSYDEPSTFAADLIKAGIPAEKICKDYAGFRTLDSVVRSKEIFGQDTITVISQPFHNKRAIYIANWKGMTAIGYNSEKVKAKYGVKIWFRERLARGKMMLDLLGGKAPRYLGESIKVE